MTKNSSKFNVVRLGPTENQINGLLVILVGQGPFTSLVKAEEYLRDLLIRDREYHLAKIQMLQRELAEIEANLTDAIQVIYPDDELDKFGTVLSSDFDTFGKA